jgi:hypothetical protein
MSRLTLLRLSVLLLGVQAWVPIANTQEHVRNVGMDAKGNLIQWEITGNDHFIPLEILRSGATDITITPATPINVAEDVINNLLKNGAQIELSGAYCLFKGHLFYAWNPTISPPKLALDRSRLCTLAKSPACTDDWNERFVAAYFIYVSKTGEILGLQQLFGPQMLDVENELMRTSVTVPGRLGPDPVPVRWTVPI